MNKLLPQFQNVTLWQSLSLAVFSVLLTWVATIYAASQYVLKTGNDLSKLGGLPQVAVTTFDVTVIVFGVGVYFVAGIACLILVSMQKRFRESPVVQSIWGLFIVAGVALSYAFR